MPDLPPQPRRPGDPLPTAATECRNSSPHKDRPTRIACQIDFDEAGERRDAVYAVARMQEGLILLARDHPNAYNIEAKMKEVPMTDFPEGGAA